ncbi:hypothetical protein NQ314_019899, partial [Rhamnusium bicolor]
NVCYFFLLAQIKSSQGVTKEGSENQIESTHYLFENVFKNLKNLRELEIFTCPGCNGNTEIPAYPLIGYLENLERLTLDVTRFLDGSFLKEVWFQVFIKCSHLKSLNLTCFTSNKKFIINLFQNLQYASNLRDFRLRYKDSLTDHILNTLIDLPNNKLLRIFIKCEDLKYSHRSLFTTFMQKNPQLIFLCLVVRSNTRKQNCEIQRIFNSFKKDDPAKIFCIKPDVSFYKEIPMAHRDMIFNTTNVAVINLETF